MMRESGGTVWEERRERRGLFGRLLLWGFVMWNAWVVVEVLSLLARIETARDKVTDNGLAFIAVSAVGNARLNEWLVWWLAVGLVWGALVLMTRGRKVLVERRPKGMPAVPVARAGDDLAAAIRSVRRES